MKRYLFLILLISVTKLLSAQEMNSIPVPATQEYSDLMNKLDVSQDTRLTKMVENHIGKNSRTGGMQGFVLEIFSRTGATAREEALRVKSEFLAAYPGIGVHVKFISPDFKVRVGDFRTKNEALKLMKQLEGKYKAFIVPDIIDFPKTEPSGN